MVLWVGYRESWDDSAARWGVPGVQAPPRLVAEIANVTPDPLPRR